MACSCSKKATRNTISPRTGLARTAVRSGGIAVNNQTVNALSVTPSENRSPSGLNGERRKVEKIRRDAVNRALGR